MKPASLTPWLALAIRAQAHQTLAQAQVFKASAQAEQQAQQTAASSAAQVDAVALAWYQHRQAHVASDALEGIYQAFHLHVVQRSAEDQQTSQLRAQEAATSLQALSVGFSRKAALEAVAERWQARDEQALLRLEQRLQSEAWTMSQMAAAGDQTP